MFSNFLGDQAQNIIGILENLYLDNIANNDNLAWLNFVVDIGTTFFWTGYVGRDVQLNLQNNNPDVYVYEFTYYSGADSHKLFPGWQPVTHGAETSFVFMGWDPSDVGTGKINMSDIDIAFFFGESWTNFAKTGKPTTDGSWKPATSAINNTAYYEIGWSSGARPAYRNKDQFQFNEILPNLLGGEFPRDIPDYNNGTRTGCQPTFVQGTVDPHHCYTVFNTAKNQTDATYYCSKYFITPFKLGLKNINNASENSELLSYLNSNSLGKTCTKSYIGLYSKNSKWIWQNGNGTYYNWDSGYPSSDPTATCVVINSSNGKWQNQACSLPQCYICEAVIG
uniref:C-type lectin domain-containing protein n=1 Tax=Acrobeloides nanus TaxID=290746 RepID=A0A914DUI9_9BILA